MFHKTCFLAKAKLTNATNKDVVNCVLAAKNNDKIPQKTKLENQPDLMKITAVLLSTGINKNDDVFLAEEVWPARNTGAHKPINIEHDKDQIVGVIFRTFAADKNGKVIKTDSVPDQRFDIIFEGGVYSLLFDELSEEIKEQAESDELFVSVEAWFSSFDYFVQGEIIERNEKTAPILDPLLKDNGGPGVFQGKKLGRVLRNIILGGVGFVQKPANPESVIKSVGSSTYESILENKTSINRVIKDLKNYMCSVNKTKEDVIMSEKKKTDIEELQATLVAMKESYDSTCANFSEKIDDVLAKNDELTKEVDSMKASNKNLSRKQTLASLQITDDEADQILSQSFIKDDEAFESFIEVLKKTLNRNLITSSEEIKMGDLKSEDSTDELKTEDNSDSEQTPVDSNIDDSTNVSEDNKKESVEVEATDLNDDNIEGEGKDLDVDDLGSENTELFVSDDLGDNLEEEIANILIPALSKYSDKWDNVSYKK